MLALSTNHTTGSEKEKGVLAHHSYFKASYYHLCTVVLGQEDILQAACPTINNHYFMSFVTVFGRNHRFLT
jgi:hypothetical protein